MMEFDIVDVDLDTSGNKLPDKTDKIALIDADTILFASCLTFEEQTELLSKEFYTTDEWNKIMADDTYFEPLHSTYSIDLEAAYAHSMDKINSILEKTGCSDWELHFTSGRKSFRYTRVDENYKANRTNDPTKKAPYGLKELKAYFCDKYPEKAFNWYEFEADDIVVAKKQREPDKYLLVALDKDVLYSLEGRHFNYYSSYQYSIEMKFFEVNAITALKHHYIQTLTGDTADGVIGLKGIGPKKAEKLLHLCETEQECWLAVCEAYNNIGKLKDGRDADDMDAITNMRLVSMHQLEYKNNEWGVKLWKPKQ